MRGCLACITALLIGLGLPLLSPDVEAADDQDSSYGGEDQSLYKPVQPVPGPSGQSGGILGYQPVNQRELEAFLAGGSGKGAQAGAIPGTAVAQGEASWSKLPPVYLTGIVGDGPYTLGRDDVIRVDVRNQPEFSGAFVVGFDGRIQYNYMGDIPIAGLTKYEVQQVLEKLLEKFIRVPSVSVTILAYNSKVVYVIGEVGQPGKFIMRGDAIKLREAILAAGLPTHRAALSRVHVIQPDLYKPHIRVVNVKRILYKGKLQDDVNLYPGELVVVPSTVLSKVNDFLGSILAPANNARSTAALAAPY